MKQGRPYRAEWRLPLRMKREWRHAMGLGLIGLLGLGAALPTQAGLQVGQMLCDYQENPLGLDVSQPALAWKVVADQRDERQTAYQVLVACSRENLERGNGDLWDSGRVASDATVQIRYAGQALPSRRMCFWKVRVWDKAGAPSPWSAVARWEMGLLDPLDWKAVWIARNTDVAAQPLPLLRREFTVAGQVRRARLYIAGLGYAEARLNGDKVGDHHLDPAYTRYDKRVLYVTHDVTAGLKQGPNALGVMLGNGWFNVQARAAWDFDKAPWRAAPRLLASLQIEYADGHTEIIGTDRQWKCAAGPVLFNTIYGGETHDARLEPAGWDAPGFEGKDWTAVQLVDAPKGKLVAQQMPPIRAGRELAAVKITEPRPGVFLFDFGQNMAGYARLSVSGPAGRTVTLKYAERLAPDGLVDQKHIAMHVTSRGTKEFQTDTYILKGEGKETWHTKFAYHGFQYVEVTGFPGTPTADSVRAVFTHTAVPVAGSFKCSSELLNKIQEATRWSYLSNLQGIPTDCPHREKNGWTGDAHLAAEQAMFNYFPPAIYAKWLNDLDDAQKPDGRLPGIVPTGGWGYHQYCGPAWDSALILIPYYQYLYYGDEEVLRAHYAAMKRYVDYMASRVKDGGILGIGLNDWVPWKTRTPADVTDTAYFFVDARIVALAAQLLGNAEDATKYNALAETIKESFNKCFYNPKTGQYYNGGQTALSCALYQGLVPPEHRERVLANLVAAVEKTNGHIDTGILGAKYLLNALLENGRADVAYRIVSQKTIPGWGWWIEQGATTLWDLWDGTSSRNHIMFGDVSAWFYKALAGIRPDPQAPGFKHFFIAPQVVGDLTSASAEYESIRGLIVSDWKLAGYEFRLRVVIPANSRATITLPASDIGAATANGVPLAKSAGLSRPRLEGGHVVCEAGSGEYEFRCRISGAQHAVNH